MFCKRLTRGLPTIIMLLAGTAAVAGGINDVIATRQAHYREIGKAFKAINDQLKSGSPDLAVIRANAPVVERLARQQGKENWFPAGSQAGQGLQTSAKPAIWQNRADFEAKRADFLRAAAGYTAITGRGDVAAIGAATATIGKTCKGCHESYRDQDRS